MKLFSSLLLFYIFTSFSSFCQSLNQKYLDPYGYVTKYDTAFNGIGPEVYILPLPRTLKEEMIDTYQEISLFEDSIHTALQHHRFLSYFQKTSNQEKTNTIFPDSLKLSEMMIKPYIEQKNHPIVYALYNRLALVYLQQNRVKNASEALQNALSHAQIINNQNDIAALQSNMALIYIITGKLEEAGLLENEHLVHAQKSKDLPNQATSYTRIAQIEAYKKNYRAAENTIIRKAIPLFNKSKSYSGKIEAWIMLAEIYRNQNKHTEAQWFLIQARDLAKNQNFTENLALIEYMLGSSKIIQRNYKVAKTELEQALSLVKNTSNPYLQIAIVEQLGQANVKLGDYEMAKKYLIQYQHLYNNLF